MCPYYNESQKCCAIYKTTQNSYNDANYCHEQTYRSDSGSNGAGIRQ